VTKHDKNRTIIMTKRSALLLLFLVRTYITNASRTEERISGCVSCEAPLRVLWCVIQGVCSVCVVSSARVVCALCVCCVCVVCVVCVKSKAWN
jgi:hypothetical protein